jgi:hypothetical protein
VIKFKNCFLSGCKRGFFKVGLYLTIGKSEGIMENQRKPFKDFGEFEHSDFDDAIRVLLSKRKALRNVSMKMRHPHQ